MRDEGNWRLHELQRTRVSRGDNLRPDVTVIVAAALRAAAYVIARAGLRRSLMAAVLAGRLGSTRFNRRRLTVHTAAIEEDGRRTDCSDE